MTAPRTLAAKLVDAHRVKGEASAGAPVSLRIDQTLTQDATGTLVMLALEAMELDRVKTETSAQYVDHNLIQADHRNPDDHLFLKSACERFGLWYSGPGNGVSHPVHMEYFGKPGLTLLGSDSHTCAAGALGMLAMGAGGIDVAGAMAGRPFTVRMPQVFGVRLSGRLPAWCSAKDVILEMLRRHGVRGGVHCIIEYHGPGLEDLTAMDRHVIANMGAELGATASVFPSDGPVRDFLRSQGREEDWRELSADEGAVYDKTDEIDLSQLEPLIATPSSPGNVVSVHEVAGEPIYQAYIGSSANPGYRDFAVPAVMVEGRRIASGVSFDINPSSRQVLETLVRDGHVGRLLAAGARLHQTGCNGCIGMGQAPATGRNSLRTVPRNFPGRSGTREDRVFLCSPETATASALRGRITDPRELEFEPPDIAPPADPVRHPDLLQAPLEIGAARRVELVKGPNVGEMPRLPPLPENLAVRVLLVTGDDLSTDEILPAGTDVLPYRSNIAAISEFAFRQIDDSYPRRAREVEDCDGHAVVGGANYGQGSSREHAALAPRYLGLRVVMTVSFARIHRQNLINFGVVPLVFEQAEDKARLDRSDRVLFRGLRQAVAEGERVVAQTSRGEIGLRHELSPRERAVLLAGGVINHLAAA